MTLPFEPVPYNEKAGASRLRQTDDSCIRFENVTLGYGKRIILRDLNFSIATGDYFGLVGPNGAGKTTILRAILRTLRPLAGEIRIGSDAMPAPRFGYVPQRDKIDSVLPYTVREVVMMGRYRDIGMFHRARKRDTDAVDECLRHVEMEARASHAFGELSGGQKQRALIARAIAAEPDILILDEPTNGMDLASRASILELIDTLHESNRLTVLMVTHLLDDVANHVQRLAIVERSFFQVGNTGEVLTEANLSAIYGRAVRVVESGGRISVQTGGSHAVR